MAWYFLQIIFEILRVEKTTRKYDKMWLILIVVWKHIDGFIKYLGSKGALKKITLNNKYKTPHMPSWTTPAKHFMDMKNIFLWICSFRVFRQINLVMFLNFKSGPPEYLYGRWGKGYWCLRRWLRTRLLTFKRPGCVIRVWHTTWESSETTSSSNYLLHPTGWPG